MPLTITAKDRVANDFSPPTSDDIRTAFLQIERYARQLESYLGVSQAVTGSRSPGDVPVGGLVAQAITPASTTNYSGGATTVITLPVNVVQGHTYMVNLDAFQAQQITNAVSTTVQIYARDTLGVIPSGTVGLKALIENSIPLNGYVQGSGTCIGTAPSTGVTTFTVGVQAPTASLQIPANCIQIFVTRVA